MRSIEMSSLLTFSSLLALATLSAAQLDCTLPIDVQDATCGGSTGFRCDVSQCCSQYGYCGITEAHCGSGCQSGFGTCSLDTPAECSAEDAPEEPEDNPSDPETPPDGKGLIGQYWETWHSMSDIEWSYTDLAYYFVTVPNADGELENPSGDMQAFVDAAHAHGRKAILVLGGWTGSQHFSNLVSETRTRNNFVRNINLTVRGIGFDGVDVDWEYPNQAGAGCNSRRPEDTENLLLMLQRMRTAIGSNRIIAMAVTGSGLVDRNGAPLQDYSEFNNVVDYLTLMIYDTYGPGWSAVSGPNAPLWEAANGITGDKAVEYYIGAGMDANKLLLGVPSYSYTFKTRSSTLASRQVGCYTSKLYQDVERVVPQGDCYDQRTATTAAVCTPPSQGPSEGDGDEGSDDSGSDAPSISAFTGTWTYKSMIECGALSEDGKQGLGGYRRYWDEASGTPFLFNERRRTLIPYEDSQSVQLKTEYARDMGLAGIAIYASRGFNRQVLSAARSGFQ